MHLELTVYVIITLLMLACCEPDLSGSRLVDKLRQTKVVCVPQTEHVS